MRTEEEITEVYDDLKRQEDDLMKKLELHANLDTTLISNEEKENRAKEVKAMNKVLDHLRIQLHSFRWVLAGSVRK